MKVSADITFGQLTDRFIDALLAIWYGLASLDWKKLEPDWLMYRHPTVLFPLPISRLKLLKMGYHASRWRVTTTFIV